MTVTEAQLDQEIEAFLDAMRAKYGGDRIGFCVLAAMQSEDGRDASVRFGHSIEPEYLVKILRRAIKEIGRKARSEAFLADAIKQTSHS